MKLNHKMNLKEDEDKKSIQTIVNVELYFN